MKPSHVPELDGLRGIAVLLVILAHFGAYAPTQRIPAADVLRVGFDFGWVGVDLFFVLSGFLITGILLEAKGSPNYFQSFYMRRVLRILPLYYVSVAVLFWFFRPAHVPASEQVWYWTYLANWRIAFDPDSVVALSHFWSLAIEEQFYLVWPLVVFLISESALIPVCLGLIFIPLALRNVPAFQALHAVYDQLFYTLTPFRVDSLGFGALAALLVRSRSLSAVTGRWLTAAFAMGAAATAAVVFAGRSIQHSSKVMDVWGLSAIALTCATVVLYARLWTGSNRLLSKALRNGALRSFGKYSYAIYIIQWPLSLAVDEFFRTRVTWGGGLGAALVSIAVGTAISYAAAWVSWNLIEQHFLRLKGLFPYRSDHLRKSV